MKSFLKFLLIALFIIGFPLVLFLAIPKLNGFTITKLESALQQRQVYSQLSTVAQQQLGQHASSDDPASQIGSLIKDELTPQYVQTKINSLLDQTTAWSTGQTKTPPNVSFNDLQQTLMAKSPVTKLEIDSALQQLKAQQDQYGSQLPQVADDQKTQQAIQQLLDTSGNLDKVAAGDWTLSLEKPLAGLPTMVKWYEIGLPIAAGLLLLCLIGACLLGRGTVGKLKVAAWILAMAGLWNALLSVGFWYFFLGDVLFNLFPNSGVATDISRSVVHSLQSSVYSQYLGIELGTSIGLVVVGLVLFIAAKMIKMPANQTPLAQMAPHLAGSVVAAPLAKPTDVVEAIPTPALTAETTTPDKASSKE